MGPQRNSVHGRGVARLRKSGYGLRTGYHFLIGGSKGGDLARYSPALTSLLLPYTQLLLAKETTFIHPDTLVHYIPYLSLLLICPDLTLLSTCLLPLLLLRRRPEV